MQTEDYINCNDVGYVQKVLNFCERDAYVSGKKQCS